MRVGKRRSTRDQSRSAAQLTMWIGCTVIITSTGASIEVKVMPAPEPMWIATTLPSSAQAFQNGSQ